MIGRGPAMQELFGLIRRLSPHVRTVLITGETGTGKELVARALPRVGPRRDRRSSSSTAPPSCETLFESELFGHTRGAFTGATDNKAGPLRAARRRDAVPRRDRRAAARRCRPSCCACSRRRSAARRATSRGASTCACIAATNRDLRAEVDGGTIPRRPVLPAERRRDARAAAARAARGHSVSDRCLRATGGDAAGQAR